MTAPTRSELSNDELDRMEKRCKAASRGPWISYVVGRDLEAGLNFIELGSYETMELVGGTVADQDFVAQAREDIPQLIREVRTLKAQVALLRALHPQDETCHDIDEVTAATVQIPAVAPSYHL